MRWSKLKSLVEARFVPSLEGRVEIFSTTYGRCTCGHAWITIDKEVVANFCTRAFWNTRPEYDEAQGKFVRGPEIPRETNTSIYKYVEYGELDRQDAYKACWEFVHELSIDEALVSSDPLIQSLGVLDAQVGKRRLRKLNVDSLHPLAARMLGERLNAENKQRLTPREPPGAKAGVELQAGAVSSL